MKYAFKQASRPYQAIRRSGSYLESKPMTGRKPDLGLKKFGRSGLGLAKSNSAYPIFIPNS